MEHIEGPNTELSNIVSNALVDSGLILEKRKTELGSKLLSGKATASDWRLWVEEGLDGRTSNKTPQD